MRYSVRSGLGPRCNSDTSAHAAAWLRLCPSQRRPRHTGATGLARPQEHPAHSALHRVGCCWAKRTNAVVWPWPPWSRMTQSGQTPDRNPAMQWAPPISLTLSASLFGIRAEAETNGTDGGGSPFSFAKRCLRRTIGLTPILPATVSTHTIAFRNCMLFSFRSQ